MHRQTRKDRIECGYQGSNNRSFLHQMEDVTFNKPYINYGDVRIFVIYDPPHLLKNIQNNLKKTDFEINGKIVGW